MVVKWPMVCCKIHSWAASWRTAETGGFPAGEFPGLRFLGFLCVDQKNTLRLRAMGAGSVVSLSALSQPGIHSIRSHSPPSFSHQVTTMVNGRRESKLLGDLREEFCCMLSLSDSRVQSEKKGPVPSRRPRRAQQLLAERVWRQTGGVAPFSRGGLASRR